MKKIFIFQQPNPDFGGVSGYALCEDGRLISSHISSNALWLRYDMGLSSKRNHDSYANACPDGYELVDLIDWTDDQLDSFAELGHAFELANKKWDDEQAS